MRNIERGLNFKMSTEEKMLLSQLGNYSEFSKKLDELIIPYVQIGEKLQFREWSEKLPWIKWPSEYYVKSIPNCGGSFVRYLVSLNPFDEKPRVVSIYLDCIGALGFMPWPYWEVFDGEETYRCKWDNIEGKNGLLELVKEALKNEHNRGD